MITYQEFKAKYPVGTSVSSPENTFKGECVSPVRRYMAEVQGVVTGPLGNAVDFATNPTFLKYYEKVSSPKVGDIMVWGDDVGTWTGPAGHIAIYDGTGYMWNQNYNGSRIVTINKIFTPGFIGYFRLKGERMDQKITFEEAQDLSQTVLLRPEPVTREWFNSSAEKNMTFMQVYRIWKDSQEAKNNRFKVWDYDRLKAEKQSTSTTGASEAEVALSKIKEGLGLK